MEVNQCVLPELAFLETLKHLPFRDIAKLYHTSSEGHNETINRDCFTELIVRTLYRWYAIIPTEINSFDELTREISKSYEANQALDIGIKNRNYDIARTAIENGADDIISGIFKNDIDDGDASLIANLLINNINQDKSQKELSNTLLKSASMFGLLRKIKKAVKRGANPNIGAIIAAENGKLEALTLLVTLGADIKAFGNKALHEAVRENHLDVVKYLVSIGADVTFDDNILVASAASRNYIDILKYLVSVGADIHVDDDFVLYTASLAGYLDIVKYVMTHMPFRNERVINEAINLARSQGRQNVVDFLSEK